MFVGRRVIPDSIGVFSLLGCLLIGWPARAAAQEEGAACAACPEPHPPAQQTVRGPIRFDLNKPLLSPGNHREPILEEPLKPGIYRGFLVWRQRYAHLALCNMVMCHGSCIVYGDGCLVCAQEPILPLLLGETLNGCKR